MQRLIIDCQSKEMDVREINCDNVALSRFHKIAINLVSIDIKLNVYISNANFKINMLSQFINAKDIRKLGEIII